MVSYNFKKLERMAFLLLFLLKHWFAHQVVSVS